MRASRALVLLATLSCAGAIAAGTGSELNPVRRQPAAAHRVNPQRLIVKFRSNVSQRSQAQGAEDPAAALAKRMRLTLRESHPITSRMHVLQLEPDAAGESLDSLLARLRADPQVEYAEPDYRRYPLAVPNDPLFPASQPDHPNGQWFLQNVEASAVDAQTAWDTINGSNGIVVADIDTGLRYEHPDLGIAANGGRLLPGYDFISPDAAGPLTANDGNGRDADPSDPGDWVSDADLNNQFFQGCDQSDSSWHGTRVAGILGALTDNAVGVAGMTWKSYVLPARVLGKCGGYDSDIIAGMLWAGGLSVTGVAANPFPARVENLSLGSSGSCPNSYADAVEQLTAAGVVVVAAAGNDGGPVGPPANCPGVIGVAGLRQIGTKVGFSNLGPEITVSAPGGNCVNSGVNDPCLYTIDTTSNTGTTSPAASTYTDAFNINVGTSFASPIVSGIAALMISANGNLTPALVAARLQEGAQPFPVNPAAPGGTCHVPVDANDLQTDECNCTVDTCGAGMANARASVQAALRPIAAIEVTSNVAPGQPVTLDGSGSAAACGQSISTYAWTVQSGVCTITAGADTATPTVMAPNQDSCVVTSTVTDDAGLEDTADLTLTTNGFSTSAPEDARGVACPVDIVVPKPAISVTNNPHVGEDLQQSITVTLAVAPLTPTDITVSVASAGVAVVSDDAATLGTETLVFPDMATNQPLTVLVQGIAFGTTKLTVSADGYEADTETNTVDPSGFIIEGGDFSVADNALDHSVIIESGRLARTTLAFTAAEPLRPGLTVDVAVTSSSTSVGVITDSPVQFGANVGEAGTDFDPLVAGTSTISIETPAGFDTPDAQQAVTATVTASGNSGGGGGGGGAFDLVTLLGGLLSSAFARQRRRHAVSA
jgi:serine protease